MNRILIILEKLLTMIFACLCFISVMFTENIILIVFVLAVSVLTFLTSLIDMFKDKKCNVLNLVLLLVLVLNLVRPLLDSFIFRVNYPSEVLWRYILTMLEQNFLLNIIFMTILFVINFKLGNKKTSN